MSTIDSFEDDNKKLLDSLSARIEELKQQETSPEQMLEDPDYWISIACMFKIAVCNLSYNLLVAQKGTQDISEKQVEDLTDEALRQAGEILKRPGVFQEIKDLLVRSSLESARLRNQEQP